MSDRRLPVRPDLDQLKHQAKDLLRSIRARRSRRARELTQVTRTLDPADAKLADAQLVLARELRAPSWPRLVQACQLIRCDLGGRHRHGPHARRRRIRNCCTSTPRSATATGARP